MIALRHLNTLNINEFDEVWLIMRTLKKEKRLLKHSNVYHVPELSPSKNLFHTYLNYKKQGKWTTFTIKNKYIPKFANENPKEKLKYLDHLYKMDKKGKRIALVCTCPDTSICHKTIIGIWLTIMSCNMEDKGKMLHYINTLL